MSLRKSTIVLAAASAALAAVLAGALCAPAGAQTPLRAAGPVSRPAGRVDEAIQLQGLMKKRYAELVFIMAEVSRKLEATDPKAAASISAAAQKAEAALIADDMDKVVVLLQSGLVLPADATQAKVVSRLREVLNALRGEDGLEWRMFLLQELQQQMADLAMLIEREQVLERQSRMLAFGDAMRARITEVRGKVDAAAKEQEDVLGRTSRMAPSPAAMEFAGVRQGIAGLLRRFETARDALWNPTPPPDQMARNVVAVRRYHAETVALRTDLRALLNRDAVQSTASSQPAEGRGLNVVDSVSKAADELDRSGKAIAADDLKEGHVALAEAKAHLQDALERLDETVQGFADVRPAVKISADQKKVDDAVAGLEPAMRELFPGGLAAIDDSPVKGDREAQAADRLADRPTEWAQQTPVLLALDPSGAAARQQQALDKVRDWSSRLEESLREMDRLKDDPRYPIQKREQESIVAELRSILDTNRRRADTVGADAELTGIFDLLRVAIANAADCGAQAAALLGKEEPAAANAKENEVIHLLTTVRDRVMPELKMDKNKYAMNEQMLGRIQRMIMKEKICRAQAQSVWEKRKADGAFGRTEQLWIDAIAKDQGSLEEDFKVCWEIMNSAHNVGFGLFPPEARVLLELARSESKGVVKRLGGYDPGAETQKMQDVILDRLKTIETLLGPGFGQKVEELDRKFTYDSFLSRMSLHNTRVNEIGLLVKLQEDVNRRTAEVEKARREGKADAGVEQEAEQLRRLQEHVRQGLAMFAEMDARSWMGIDYMPTKYGTNKGGAVQGPAAPSAKGGN
jgi:hypothetical protein